MPLTSRLVRSETRVKTRTNVKIVHIKKPSSRVVKRISTSHCPGKIVKEDLAMYRWSLLALMNLPRRIQPTH